MKEEIIYRLALLQLPGIGDLFAKLLTEYFKGAKHLFFAHKSTLREIPGIGNVLLKTLTDKNLINGAIKRAEKEWLFTQKHNIEILLYDHESYPERLKQCDDAPFVLYYKGNANLNHTKIISVVGTRKATAYGEDMTAKLIDELQPHNVLIVSGLAYGIDAYAHKFALAKNLPTIGVLAHGLDKIYPSKHRQMAKQMLANGGLLTEFISETNPDRENFPKRNRIVAGLADATLVIEAAEKGGALITANIAHSYGRDVLAVPGRKIDTYSAGCNKIIKANKAAMVENANDILYALNWEKATQNSTQTTLPLFNNLNPQELKIIDIIKKQGIMSKEQLAFVMQQKVQNVAGALFNLELNGFVKALPGNNYQLKA